MARDAYENGTHFKTVGALRQAVFTSWRNIQIPSRKRSCRVCHSELLKSLSRMVEALTSERRVVIIYPVDLKILAKPSEFL